MAQSIRQIWLGRHRKGCAAWPTPGRSSNRCGHEDSAYYENQWDLPLLGKRPTRTAAELLEEPGLHPDVHKPETRDATARLRLPREAALAVKVASPVGGKSFPHLIFGSLANVTESARAGSFGDQRSISANRESRVASVKSEH